MRIVVLFNPISGAGRAAAAGKAVCDRLSQLGHDALIVPTQRAATRTWLDVALTAADLLVVAGGDGAIRMAAGSACRTGVPLYHLPYGTENLFAREFAMNREESTLLGAIQRREIRKADVGLANGRPFLLMASIGYDAEVVHDLAGRRGASITHFSYLAPVVSQMRKWKPPQLSVMVDGRQLDDGGPGFVVIGNCKQYGWRLNPAGRASMFDGQLDVAYFPARSRLDLIQWIVRCRRQRHYQHQRLAYRLGQRVTVASQSPFRFQLDGDPAGCDDEHAVESVPEQPDSGEACGLRIEIQPGVLPVLVP